MPTTFVGLLWFVVLLVPGFIYTLRREGGTPRRNASALRETVQLVFVSLLADTIVLLCFAVLHAAAPSWTPDIDSLIRKPGAYATVHYGELLAWLLGLLSTATVLAGFAARGWLGRLVDRLFGTDLSGWGLMFSQHPRADVHVGCILDDGSYVAGRLWSYSTLPEDAPDRELTLLPPITYRAPNTDQTVDSSDIGAVTVNARRIVFLTVSYVTTRSR